MTEWCAEDLLYLRLGTETPNWSLSADSDTLFLSAGRNELRVAVRLGRTQLARIRAIKGGFVQTSVRVTILGAHLQLHLVGRKVNEHAWKGRASGDANFLHMAVELREAPRHSMVVDFDATHRTSR